MSEQGDGRPKFRFLQMVKLAGKRVGNGPGCVVGRTSSPSPERYLVTWVHLLTQQSYSPEELEALEPAE